MTGLGSGFMQEGSLSARVWSSKAGAGALTCMLPAQAGAPGGGATQHIQDNTETNLINLRRTIYLTIMSALDFEEAGHKLMNIFFYDWE